MKCLSLRLGTELEVIDQTLLPQREEWITVHSPNR
jgi:methylthioribose-1-phosphate isomerase